MGQWLRRRAMISDGHVGSGGYRWSGGLHGVNTHHSQRIWVRITAQMIAVSSHVSLEQDAMRGLVWGLVFGCAVCLCVCRRWKWNGPLKVMTHRGIGAVVSASASQRQMQTSVQPSV